MNNDVIIVLAGGINHDGTLTQTTKERTELGISLFNEKKAPQILFSGAWSFMFSNPPKTLEAEGMKKYATLQAVPKDKILVDLKSKDTLGSAYFTKVDFAKLKIWRRLVVVTSDFHINRVRYLFHKVYGPGYTIDYQPSFTKLSRIRFEEIRELERAQLALSRHWLDSIIDGDDVAIAQLLFSKHPAYAKKPEFSVEQLVSQLKNI